MDRMSVSRSGGARSAPEGAPRASRSGPPVASAAAGSAMPAWLPGQREAGSPLAEADRARFEPIFGHDLSDVRLHQGPSTDDTVRALGATALTVGSDIALRRDRYQPGTAEGQALLAHELTHVVQQRLGGSAGGASEHEAAGVAGRIRAGLTGSVPVRRGVARGSMQAAPDPAAPVPAPAGPVPAPAGPIPAAPAAPACGADAAEQARIDAFRFKVFSVSEFQPSTGFGLFDATYIPLISMMLVTSKIHLNFLPASDTPDLGTLVSMITSGQDVMQFFWTDAEKETFKNDFATRVFARFSGAHSFVSNKPCWDFTAIPLVTPVFVDDPAGAQYVIKTHKVSKSGVAPGSAINDPTAAPRGMQGTGDLKQTDTQTQANFNSTAVATTERQRLQAAALSTGANKILFAQDKDVVTPGEEAKLKAFADVCKAKYPTDPSIPLFASGFASAEGEAGHNSSLSLRRAEKVAAVLTARGIPQPVFPMGFGATGAPNDAANRRVDLEVDTTFETTYTGNTFSTIEHEFGHMLGLPDEYSAPAAGSNVDLQNKAYDKLVREAGLRGVGAYGEQTSSMMSNGIDALPRHYVTMWEALGSMTSPDLTRTDWTVR